MSRPLLLAVVSLCLLSACPEPETPFPDEPAGAWSFARAPGDGIVAEAGFFEIPAHPVRSLTLAGTLGTARLWYVFAPADEAPEDKPLIVLFNGGPGASTSAVLFAFGVGPRQLVPGVDPTTLVVADNPDSWTRFANLLFVDARQTGFSYGVGAPTDEHWDPGLDAADVARLVVEFLVQHPVIAANPVVLAGESYGGTRSTLMQSYFLRPGDLRGGDGLLEDHALAAAIRRHARLVGLPDDASERERAAFFAAQVHIQGAFALDLIGGGWAASEFLARPAPGLCARWQGLPTMDESCAAEVPDCSLASCLASAVAVEGFDVRFPAGEAVDKPGLAAAALGRIDTLRALTGVDPLAIEWLHAAGRSGAFRLVGGPDKTDGGDLEAHLGTLADGDRYFVRLFNICGAFPEGCRYVFNEDPGTFTAFVQNLPYTRQLVSDAVFDTAVLSPMVPTLLAGSPLLRDVQVIEPDSARRRRIRVDFEPSFVDAPPVELAFPVYGAGHAVSLGEPAVLAADVEALVGETLRR